MGWKLKYPPILKFPRFLPTGQQEKEREFQIGGCLSFLNIFFTYHIEHWSNFKVHYDRLWHHFCSKKDNEWKRNDKTEADHYVCLGCWQPWTRSQKTKKRWTFSSVFGSNNWGLFQSLVMSDPGCNNNLTPQIKTDQNFDIFHFHRTFPGAAIRRTELDQVISRPVKN